MTCRLGNRCRLVAAVAALLLAPPAGAALKTYELSGELNTFFPTEGSTLHAGAVTGTATIDEEGNGSPVLVDLEVQIDWAQELGYVPSGIPGTTVVFGAHQLIRPEPSQSGAGGTTSTISWGTLTGWTQTGSTFCHTNVPGGDPPPPSSCVLFVGFEGTGPLTPLASSSFDSDPWTFSGDGFSFESVPVEIVNLQGGSVTETVLWRGGLQVPIPGLPNAGVAALAAALTFLGARALRRTR